jgi:hypothetical protein
MAFNGSPLAILLRGTYSKNLRLPERIGTTRKWRFMRGEFTIRICLNVSVLEDKYHGRPMRDSPLNKAIIKIIPNREKEMLSRSASGVHMGEGAVRYSA